MTYVKTSLTGPRFKQQSPAGAGVTGTLRGAATNFSSSDFLSKPGVDPTLGADAHAASRQPADTIEIELTPAELPRSRPRAASSCRPPTCRSTSASLADAGAHLSFHVDQGHEQAATASRVGWTLDASAGGARREHRLRRRPASPEIDLTFSKWDEPVTIAAPPADQVKPSSSEPGESPAYNVGVTPTRRRRTGDPTLVDAAEAAGSHRRDGLHRPRRGPPAVPDEPAWLRDAPAEAKDPLGAGSGP